MVVWRFGLGRSVEKTGKTGVRIVVGFVDHKARKDAADMFGRLLGIIVLFFPLLGGVPIHEAFAAPDQQKEPPLPVSQSPKQQILAQQILDHPEQGVEAIPRSQTFIIGRVSGRARRVIPRLEAAARWIVPLLKHQGIRASRVVVTRNGAEMKNLLRTGRVDLITESVFLALSLEAQTGAKILLHEWRGGKASYNSIFVVSRMSTIGTLADLKGKRLVFEDPGSTTSFLLPMAKLREQGLQMVALANARDPVPAGRIGYVFAGDEKNVSAWVARGRVDGGAVSNLDWDRQNQTPLRFKKDLRILFTSQPVIRSLVLVRGDMAPDMVRAIEKAHLQFATDPKAEELREKHYRVSRYSKLTGKSAMALMDARKLYRSIKDLLK